MRRFCEGATVSLNLRQWAASLTRDVLALWVAARDRRTPVAASLVAGITAAYAFSPIDLIPDFIPVLGLLDDLLLVPVGIWLVIRLIPHPLFAEFRATAVALTDRPGQNPLLSAFPVLAVWFGAAALTGWMLWT